MAVGARKESPTSRERRAAIRQLAFGLLAQLVPLAWQRPAFGDLAPPPGYVETCTLFVQERFWEECHECRGHFSDRARCAELLESYGFAQRCKTRGASVWGEIWCRKKDSAAAVVPAEVIAGLSNLTGRLQKQPQVVTLTQPRLLPQPEPRPTPQPRPQPQPRPRSQQSQSEHQPGPQPALQPQLQPQPRSQPLPAPAPAVTTAVMAAPLQTQPLPGGRWCDLQVTASGAGLPLHSARSDDQRRTTASRAASLDAYRRIAEFVKGRRVGNGRTVGECLANDRTVSSKIDGLIRAARQTESRQNADGSWSVVMVQNLSPLCDILAAQDAPRDAE